MNKSYVKPLFIFRRDLRLADNTALIHALANSDKTLPCFIFDPRLIEQAQPHLNAIQFMMEALDDLDAQLKKKKSQLLYLLGIPEKIIPSLLTEYEIDGLYINRDYSPFSRRRDTQIKQICKDYKVGFHSFGDSLLNEPEMIFTGKTKPYKIFTPFFKKASARPISTPKENTYTNYLKTSKAPQKPKIGIIKQIRTKPNESLLVQGNRAACLDILSNLSRYKNYQTTRDFPNQHGTTRLSTYIKFGLCSIREVYHAITKHLGTNHPLIRQLYWRDFYTHIAFHFPYVFKNAFKSRYDSLQWNYSQTLFEMWCQGNTGFPIVDAGMRELNTTGWMHNRVRMIVGSFLTKDLHIDWRWGERYFAQHLTDYDPCVNNGNWQWAASTGADAQPYFRIFNPWRQQEKYDVKCEYIKKWIPELSDLQPKLIHRWFKPTPFDSQINYPKPIVNHKEESQYSKELFATTSLNR
ncbi:MAG: cryptochrome/photolyase family protein [Promethearchaeota archaeon]